MMRLFFVFLSMTSFLLVSPVGLKAEEMDSRAELAVTDSIYHHALEQLEKGMFDESIDNLSRLLIINPEHHAAQRVMSSLIFNPHIASVQRIRLQQLSDLLSHIQDLTQKAAYLDRKENRVRQRLISLGYFQKPQDILPGFDSIDFPRSIQDDVKQPASEDMLSELIFVLDNKKKQLLNQIRGFDEKLVEYKSFEHALASVTQRHFDISTFIEKESDDIFSHSSQFQIRQLKKEAAFLTDQVVELNKANQAYENKVNELKNEIIKYSLNLTEKNTENIRQAAEIEDAQKDYLDAKSRFKLSQAIIREKDALIKELKESKVASQDQMPDDYETDSSRQVISYLEGLVNIYQSKLLDKNHAYEKQAVRLQVFQSELMALRKQLDEKEEHIAQVENQILSLEKEITVVKEYILNESDYVGFAGEKYSENYQSLDDIHYRLIETRNFLLNQSNEFQILDDLIPGNHEQ